MGSIIDVAENHILRTVRRYSIELPLRHRFLPMTAGILILVIFLVAGSIGLLVGASRNSVSGLTANAFLLLVLPLAVVAVVVASTPARNVQIALDSPRGWLLYANAGISPRSFIYGRHVLVEAGKAALTVVAVGALVSGVIVGGSSGSWAVAVTTVNLLLALCLLKLWHVLIRPGRRLRPVPNRSRTVLATTAVGVALTWLGFAFVGRRSAALSLVAQFELWAESLAEQAVLAIGMSTLAVAVTAALCWRAHLVLGPATWADVFESTVQSKSLRPDAPALPSGHLAAVATVDARRLARSASLRLKPLISLGGLLTVGAVGALLYGALGDPWQMPDGVPRAEMSAGIVSLVAYGANVASASVLAMDADRHAFTLWQLVPDGIRTVATARALQGAVLSMLAACIGTLSLAALLDLSSRETTLCLVAGATMSVFGPVLDLAGSLLWPELEWADASEIGTSTVGRYVLGFFVGVPVAAVIAVTRPLPLDLAGPEFGLLVVVLFVLTPTLAAAVMRPTVRLVTRSIHA